ncbi:HAD-IA family hydrolase [Alteromonas sp. CYL-A6]|uniref:HAD-IA family hydrolase n=1 Tax=Alteromonas nitratireducens TaxID=3390813 RepID=UPI0034B12E3E
MRFYRPIKPVRAMTFDLDDTLYNNEPIIRHADQVLKAHLEQHYPAAAQLTLKQWRDIKRTLIAETPALASDMGELRLRSLRVALKDDISGDLLHRAARECFEVFYHARSDFQVSNEVHQTLSALSSSIPLIGITNGNVNARQIGIAPYFTHILHASLARPMKPHRAMFDEAAALAGRAPGSILHVGDNLIKDIHGAMQAGYQSAWYACNRTMNLSREPARELPHLALDALEELTWLI